MTDTPNSSAPTPDDEVKAIAERFVTTAKRLREEAEHLSPRSHKCERCDMSVGYQCDVCHTAELMDESAYMLTNERGAGRRLLSRLEAATWERDEARASEGRLREALEPFAKMADAYLKIANRVPEEDHAHSIHVDKLTWAHTKFGDYVRARAALSHPAPPAGEATAPQKGEP